MQRFARTSDFLHHFKRASDRLVNFHEIREKIQEKEEKPHLPNPDAQGTRPIHRVDLARSSKDMRFSKAQRLSSSKTKTESRQRLRQLRVAIGSAIKAFIGLT
jgi:hypothetical protein